MGRANKQGEAEQREVLDADQVIRDYYEGTPHSESGSASLDEWSTVAEQPQDVVDQAPGTLALFGGDVDAALDRADIGEEAVGGSNPTPDQDVVDDIGKGAGVTYDESEPLNMAGKIEGRDANRWELDPRSSEEYAERLESEERIVTEAAKRQEPQ